MLKQAIATAITGRFSRRVRGEAVRPRETRVGSGATAGAAWRPGAWYVERRNSAFRSSGQVLVTRAMRRSGCAISYVTARTWLPPHNPFSTASRRLLEFAAAQVPPHHCRFDPRHD
ncbi:hypothetical protein GCM10011399_09640 [Subtercola lobariae]|uniref:Uncharacterized protein n=1 Tax=Subtercola lobariae TaxID=1588641 RepID=A0A917EUX0_9MICO|nr:hypothetical protein GCM10011399_09640 [Subtercola lobariae]